jgi:hypothetical protein
MRHVAGETFVSGQFSAYWSEDRSGNFTGTNGVDSNPTLCQFQSHRFRQPDNPKLRGCIRVWAVTCGDTGYAGDVYDGQWEAPDHHARKSYAPPAQILIQVSLGGINTMNAIEIAQNNFNSWNRHDVDAIVAAYAKGEPTVPLAWATLLPGKPSALC